MGNKGITLIEILVIAVIMAILGLFVLGAVGNNHGGGSDAIRAVEAYGFREVKITTSFDFWCCGSDDINKYGFSAVNMNNQPVSGCVCGGLTKGYTVRLK